MRGYIGDFKRDAAMVRGLVQKHLAPIEMTPEREQAIRDVLQALPMGPEFSGNNCVLACKKAGIEVEYREIKELRNDEILRRMKQAAETGRNTKR